MLKTDSPRKMIPESGRKFSPCWVKNSYSDIAPSKARRNHGSCGLGDVRIGCDRTRARWLAAGEFALPIGYKGASGWSNGLPEFDWSVILSFDGERWKRVDRFSGKKQIVFRVAVPTRTARHRQAAIHTMWSTSHQMTLYGFRCIDQKWLCVAASDERKHGRILYAEATAG